MSTGLLYKVAYDEGVRALSEQQAVIDSFRNRSGLLLSAADITTSFLGAQALHGGDSNLFAWLALIAFVAGAAVSLAILWPYRWEFTADPHEIVTDLVELSPPAEIEDLYRDLSMYMHDSYLRNRDGLELLAFFFQLASGLLAFEIVLWIIAIAATP
ncbi:MAG TPA: hypothetical protein VG448_06635 [Solirubrobacterales bacterium]|nr:hypothetical protein [Solirubrobacterales bacterium]